MHGFLLFSFLSLALIGHDLFDESHGSIDGEGKERPSSSGIYMPFVMGVSPS
jgi:hypothetical protein